MTSRINAKQPLRKAQTVGSPNPANTHAPSVPISLYREVAIELKTTQAKMESLSQQNHQLTHQNQQLRVEIERVVQSALQLRQVADAHPPTPTLPASPSSLQGLELHFQNPPTVSSPVADAIAPEREPRSTAPNLFTDQEKPRHVPQTERSAEKMGGWWLAIVICFIIVTAFGTGFLIVRPLLPSR